MRIDGLKDGGRSLITAFGIVLVVAVALPAGGAAKTSSAALAFGHEVVVDHQRVTGEPSLSISPVLNSHGHHDVYVSAPFGFSTTASFIWKSEDGGQTFHLVGDETPPGGKPAMTCAGGGDSSIVNDTAGNLYFADLQGLTNVSDAVSTDGGNTFVSTCNSANAVGVDRPWLSTFGDPLTTGREYMTVDQINQCTVNCGLGQAGSNLLELTQSAGASAQAQVFSPLPAQQIEPDGIVSGTVVDQRNGDLYIVHTALTDNSGTLIGGSDANGNDNAIIVDRFPGGYSQTIATPIPPTSISLCQPYNSTGPCMSETVFHAPLNANGTSTVLTGQDFSPMAIDSAGNLYAVWSQSPVDSTGNNSGPSTIFLATSTNGGTKWSAPINVSAQIAGLQTNLFPAIAAGSSGRVDIVWYGTPTLGSCPMQPCGPTAINGVWNVYMAQTLNAVTSTGTPNASPSFTTARVTEYSNHFGAICTFGINCTTGGDRGLLDFIQVQVDPGGAANVVWADAANTDFNGNTSSAVIGFAQQVGGAGLFGSSITGPAPLFGSAPGSPASYFAANGFETPAPQGSNVDIVKSSISQACKKCDYMVTMQVASLSSLSTPQSLSTAGSDVVWLTRWELPNPSPTTGNEGNVFYAAMESDGGAAPTFYVGESICGVASTHCKFLTYPPQHTVKGSFTTSGTTSGTITIDVPLGNAGAAPGAELFSATGATVIQSQSASSGTAIFNVIDSTAPFDVQAG
jgi:hypothetical protein